VVRGDVVFHRFDKHVERHQQIGRHLFVAVILPPGCLEESPNRRDRVTQGRNRAGIVTAWLRLPITSSALVGFTSGSRDGVANGSGLRNARIDGRRYGTMIVRASAIGLSRRGERVRAVAVAADERSGQGRGDPGAALPARRSAAAARGGPGAVHSKRSSPARGAAVPPT
jgi:hypothetical protein